MGLKNLNDTQLRQFAADPDAFLADKANRELILDLNDAQLKQKVSNYVAQSGKAAGWVKISEVI